ncbi:MAG TPA: hypothetical protein VK571_00950, partial [Gemmatimonadaceae bacterium]|nr:hypothetical protein [Gemmatimonadaceae bacterium]
GCCPPDVIVIAAVERCAAVECVPGRAVLPRIVEVPFFPVDPTVNKRGLIGDALTWAALGADRRGEEEDEEEKD